MICLGGLLCMAKKVSSLALLSGIIGSLSCQSVCGVQSDLQDKSVVTFGDNIAPTEAMSERKTGKDIDEVATLFFGGKTDLFINWLSRKFGFHKSWEKLFRIAQEDPYKAAKEGFAIVLGVRYCLLLFLVLYNCAKILKRYFNRKQSLGMCLYDFIFFSAISCLRVACPISSIVLIGREINKLKKVFSELAYGVKKDEEQADNNSTVLNLE